MVEEPGPSGTEALESEEITGFGQMDSWSPAPTGDGTAVPAVTDPSDPTNTSTISGKTNQESAIITFGTKSGVAPLTRNIFADNPGDVERYCGSISFPLTSLTNPVAAAIQEGYLQELANMWQDQDIIDAAAAIAYSKLPESDPRYCTTSDYPVSNCAAAIDTIPSIADLKERKVELYRERLNTKISDAISSHSGALEWCGDSADPYALKYGWVGAPICYNKIPSINGAISSAATNIPQAFEWPLILEKILALRMQKSMSISAEDRFNPVLPGEPEETDILEGTEGMRNVAKASNAAYSEWVKAGAQEMSLSGIGVVDIINMIFGTEGVFNMLKPENRSVHPLALLAAAGRSLVETTIRNMGGSGVGILMGMGIDTGGLSQVMSSFMTTIATVTMVAGFVLFYMIPLMPFIYFFFAVAGWIKGIFEAMVGVPLWALAHLRIDGDGIPGNAAMNGYLLILEIFLRPILILFGLLASAIIFYAMARILNELWSVVVFNVSGFDMEEASATYTPTEIAFWRGPIDEFFYTVMYTIIIYMVAMASFKLVDLIPNYMLRWLGQSVEAFGETLGDPAQQLSQKATIGFSATSSQAVGAAEAGGQAAGALGQGMRMQGQTGQGRNTG